MSGWTALIGGLAGGFAAPALKKEETEAAEKFTLKRDTLAGFSRIMSDPNSTFTEKKAAQTNWLKIMDPKGKLGLQPVFATLGMIQKATGGDTSGGMPNRDGTTQPPATGPVAQGAAPATPAQIPPAQPLKAQGFAAQPSTPPGRPATATPAVTLPPGRPTGGEGLPAPQTRWEEEQQWLGQEKAAERKAQNATAIKDLEAAGWSHKDAVGIVEGEVRPEGPKKVIREGTGEPIPGEDIGKAKGTYWKQVWYSDGTTEYAEAGPPKAVSGPSSDFKLFYDAEKAKGKTDQEIHRDWESDQIAKAKAMPGTTTVSGHYVKDAAGNPIWQEDVRATSRGGGVPTLTPTAPPTGGMNKSQAALEKEWREANVLYIAAQKNVSNPSPFGDLTMVLSYLRSLYPRMNKTEIENAFKTGSLSVRIQDKALYWSEGFRLTDDQRADVLRQLKQAVDAKRQAIGGVPTRDGTRTSASPVGGIKTAEDYMRKINSAPTPQ